MTRGNQSQNICEEAYSLPQGDYIVEFFGRHSDHITCFGIRTKRGLTKTWGCPFTGEAFRLSSQNQYIKALRIGASTHIDYIEPIYESEMFVFAQVVPLNTNSKCTQQCGKRQKDTVDFDDGDFVANKFNYRISCVKVWHDQKFVYGLQVIYEMDGTNKSPGMHCGMGNNLRCEQLNLNDGEHITKVFVRAGDIIDHLTFFTDQGKVVSFGGTGGNPYVLTPPPKHHFVAFSGGNGGHLHHFEGIYDEIY